MIDEVSELRSHLEREQSLRIELEEQLKDYATRLGETYVESKLKENTQTTIQYHHNTNTVSNLMQRIYKLLLFKFNFEFYKIIQYFYI